MPVGLLFVLTGLFLTFDVPVASREQRISIDAPLAPPTLGDAKALVASEFDRAGIPLPSGDVSVKAEKSGWSFSWGGSGSGAKMTARDGKGDLSMQSNGLLRRLEQLHKAKGAIAFKVLAAAWAVGLIGLFSSGTVMALQVKALRKSTWLAIAAGSLSFLAIAILS